MIIKKALLVNVFGAAWVLTSCSPKVTSSILRTYQPEEWLEDVVVLKESDPLPSDAEWIGTVDVKGKGSYEKMAEMARFRAWEKGAKYIKIKNYGVDGVRSDIHVMNSDVYHADTAKVSPDRVLSINEAGTAGVYANGTSPVTSADNILQTPTVDVPINLFRAYVGYGRRLNKIAPGLSVYEREHVKRLMNGAMFGAEFIQYFNRAINSGLGIRYQIYHSSSADAATALYENGTTKEGVLNETVNISFLGPIYSGRFISRNRKHLIMDNVGLGVLFYNDAAKFEDEKMTVTGRTLGFTFDVSYSYSLSDRLTLGADISYTSGVLKKATYSDGDKRATVDFDKENYEGLVHLGVCAQLVYTF